MARGGQYHCRSTRSLRPARLVSRRFKPLGAPTSVASLTPLAPLLRSGIRSFRPVRLVSRRFKAFRPSTPVASLTPVGSVGSVAPLWYPFLPSCSRSEPTFKHLGAPTSVASLTPLAPLLRSGIRSFRAARLVSRRFKPFARQPQSLRSLRYLRCSVLESVPSVRLRSL